MKFAKYSLLALSALALVASIPHPAQGSTVTFDSVLTPPCAVGPAPCTTAPGFYNGSGNPDGGFTVVLDNGIEIALRAKYRQNPAVIDNPTGNVYSVVAGFQTNTTSGGNGANGTRAAWSLDYDINLRPGGVGSGILDNVDLNTSILFQDLTASTSNSFNPFGIPDNSTWGTTGKRAGDNTAAGIAGGDWAAQNSENCVFVGLCTSGFNVNDNHLYFITLTVGNASGILATDSIYVRVGDAPGPSTVPEPGSMLLLGTGLAVGAARFRNRRRLKK